MIAMVFLTWHSCEGGEEVWYLPERVHGGEHLLLLLKLEEDCVLVVYVEQDRLLGECEDLADNNFIFHRQETVQLVFSDAWEGLFKSCLQLFLVRALHLSVGLDTEGFGEHGHLLKN